MSYMKHAYMDCAEGLDGLIQSIDLWWRLNNDVLSKDRKAQILVFKALASLHEVRLDLGVPMLDEINDIIADGVLADLGSSEKGETRRDWTRPDATGQDPTGLDET